MLGNMGHLISVLGFSRGQSRCFVAFAFKLLSNQSRILRFQSRHLWFGMSSAGRHDKQRRANKCVVHIRVGLDHWLLCLLRGVEVGFG